MPAPELSPRHALFPGTFDPITLGHADLVVRAARVFERVTVAIASHPTKQGLFEPAERLALVRATFAGLEGGERIDAVALAGLVVDGCRMLGCGTIVRGLRGSSDLDYELPMAGTNRTLEPAIDTLFLTATPSLAHVSSTLVRQIAELGGDVSPFVPEPVQRALAARFA